MLCVVKPSGAFAWHKASPASNLPMSWKPSDAPSKAKPGNSKPHRTAARCLAGARHWRVGRPEVLLLAVVPSRRHTPDSRRDRQADVDRQAVRGAVLGFDRALHRLDIAPCD